MNMLFHSDKCEYSKSVILSLKQANLLDNFKLICVDDKIVRDKVKDFIKVVPSMTLVECPNILTISEIYKWIEGQKFMTKNATTNSRNARQMNSIDKVNDLKNKFNKNLQKVETEPWKTGDFLAFDPYAKHISLTSVDKDDDINGYSLVSDTTENKIFTGEEENKLCEKDHEKLLRKQEKIRKFEEIERNINNKKSENKMDFTKIKITDTEKLVHNGYYEEIIKDLSRTSKHRLNR